MRRYTHLKVAISAMAATIAFSGWAAAQDASPRPTQDRPAGGRTIPPPIVRLFDRDGDGKLNAEEETRFREDLRKRQAGGALGGRRPAGAGMQRPLPEGTQAHRDVHYGPHETRNLYDLYVPKSDKPLPLVIWIHGGGWQNGNKGGGPAMALLEQGFAVATINYRLSGDAIFPAQIHDCKAAVRHLRGNAKEYGIDPERFGVWGSSAGGHLVALVGTSGDVKELEGNVGDFTNVSSRVQAVCDWFGPTDFLKMRGRHDDAGSPESKLIGGPIQENKDLVAKANPITYVSADDPAFLIQHGDKDPAVPYNQSELLRDALEKAKVPVTLVCIEGEGHGGPGFNEPDKQRQVVEFFQKQLGEKK